MMVPFLTQNDKGDYILDFEGINFGIKGKYNLANLLLLKEDNILNQLDNQSDYYFRVGFFADCLKNLERAAKSDVEMIYAKLDNNIRTEAETKNAKITESKIENMIKSDERYVETVKKYNKARFMSDVAETIKRSMEQRKDMLVSRSAFMREEMKSNLDNIIKSVE